MIPTSDYCASPMSFPNVPELLSCSFDDVSTDPSPSPPMVSPRKQLLRRRYLRALTNISQMYGSLNSRYNTYPSPTSYPQYIDSPAQVVSSIEFTDLTQPPMEDRRRRRSNTQQDTESVSNMRIVSAAKTPLTPLAPANSVISVAAPKIEPLNAPSVSAKRSTFNISNTSLRSLRQSTRICPDLIRIWTANTPS